MSVHILARPVAAPADLEQLGTLVAEPESAVADPPLPVPPASLVLLVVLSPSTPKEPGK
ncbi:hypothetical protein AB0K14_03750 [Actinosynnema sp. NPDC050801]|uniref:hypothetical protein n=1 Tax=unclassified Actinosynnema TaxID=2637065 RepID=UPI0033F55C7C